MHKFLPAVLVFCSVAHSQEVAVLPEDSLNLHANPMELPELKRATDSIAPQDAEIASQDSASLEVQVPRYASSAELAELSSLKNRSIYHIVARTESIPVAAVDGRQIGNDLNTVSAVYRQTGKPEADCSKPALSVSKRVKNSPSDVLEIVEREVLSNPDCSCEIVKAAIEANEADVETVVSIVKVAIEANPENMRLIGQCAVAVCPEALPAIRELLEQYGETIGYSAKSAKSAKSSKSAKDGEVAASPNPLDLPGGDLLVSPWDLTNFWQYSPIVIFPIPPTVSVVDPSIPRDEYPLNRYGVGNTPFPLFR